jgi:membrane protease YdiL (CAAX protease family)
MMRRLAPGVGVVLTGVAFAAAFQPWPDSGTLGAETQIAGGSASLSPVAAVLAAAALAAFLAGRYDAVDRVRGSVAAGVASVAVALYGFSVVGGAVQAGDAVGPWPAVALGTGVLAGLTALVDALGLQSDEVLVRVQSAVAGGIVGVLGLVGITLWNVVLLTIASGVVGAVSDIQEVLLGSVALGLGTVTIALAYLDTSDRGLSFVDVRWPETRDVVYGVGGFLTLLVVLLFGAELIDWLGFSSAEHGVVQTAREGDPRVLLWLIPASFLIVGPGEELLFRNVIQKSLYDVFTRPGAILVTSLVFAAVHFPAYATGGLLETVGSVLLIVPLSIVLGAVYARTENVVVSALIHGGFNAFQYAALYVAITQGIEFV